MLLPCPRWHKRVRAIPTIKKIDIFLQQLSSKYTTIHLIINSKQQ